VSTDEFSLYGAAYVLGALSPADRREFEDHLKVCATCASSVSELAGLPGLMSKVSLDQLTEEAEPPAGDVAAVTGPDCATRAQETWSGSRGRGCRGGLRAHGGRGGDHQS
jgi:anti-sigma factor RsiW